MNDRNETLASARERAAVKITAVECVPLNVPFKVDVEVGQSWGEAA